MNTSQTEQNHPITLDFDHTFYIRLGIFALVLTFGVLLGWSNLAPLHSAVVATGQISVASHNKTVQHLDGGEVKYIGVKDGDWVEQGQLLLQLDNTLLDIRLNNSKKQLFEISANLERLKAERKNQEQLTFSDKLYSQAKPEFEKETLLSQQNLFRSRRETLHSEQTVLQQRLKQHNKQMSGLQRLLKTIRTRLSLLNADIKALETLVSKNLASKAKLRETQRMKNQLMGEVFSREGEISRLHEVYAETEHQILLIKKEYAQGVVSEFSQQHAQQIRLQAEAQAIEDKLKRIDITAPVAGKIKGLEIVTLGGILKPGQEIMQLVPADQDFVIQAQISPMEIDVVKIGQKAEIRLSVFDISKQLPTLYATLRDISNDVYQASPEQAAYYKASLTVDSESLALLKQHNQVLISGMPTEVLIQTGKRTVLQYFIKPFQDMLARAFNEA